MTNKEVGTKLVELCRAGKLEEAMTTLYSPDIVSVEAGAPPGGNAECKGLAACAEKGKMFQAAHEIHGSVVEGPFPHGNDKFAVFFDYDLTRKDSKQRFHMKEVAVYWVKDGKVSREEFYYAMG